MPPDAEHQDENQDQSTQGTSDQNDGAGSVAEKDPEDVSGLKSALAKQREARKVAAAEAAKAKEERDALLKEKTEREAAEQKRKEKEAAEAGKFEELAATRERERDEAKNEATSLKAENDQLREAITGVLDSEWKTLPTEVTDAYIGADDDPLAKLAFLPKGKVLAAKLAEKAETQRGNGRDPRAGTTINGVSDEAARKANASRYA